MSEKIKLSVVIISLNEEANIERALKSVSWADEVLVYDSGSSDKTVEIAKKMGANVISGPWLGFGKTKQKASSLAKNDWILSIDSDEEVTETLKLEISEKIQNKIIDENVVYKLPRLSYYLKKWVHYGGWHPDYQARFFNKKFHNWNEAEVHEKIEAKKYENFLSHLNHYVFKSIEHQITTNNRYSSLLALELYKKGRHFSFFHFLTKPCVKFVECYFWKLGFLDGWAGYVIAKNAAHSVFLKWAKLREIELIKR